MQIDENDVQEQQKPFDEIKPKRLSHLSPDESRIRSRSMSRSSSMGTIHDEIQDTLHNLLNKQKELEHDQQVTNDWRATATKIDKILFYIFLLLTIISTVGL